MVVPVSSRVNVTWWSGPYSWVRRSPSTRAVWAYDVIRMLARDGRPTVLGDAIAHYGRIAKTLHILRLADEPGYGRQIKVQANLQEFATLSPGGSSTAAPGSSTSATRTAWRIRSGRWAWPSTRLCCSRRPTWMQR